MRSPSRRLTDQFAICNPGEIWSFRPTIGARTGAGVWKTVAVFLATFFEPVAAEGLP
ncbi:MAG: hypothetical protein QGH33_10795 [Pirellulaceae bacterium]|nr:hypothetical protein [Pirellulaceae bacterium]